MAQVYCTNRDCINNANEMDCDLIQCDIDDDGQCKNMELKVDDVVAGAEEVKTGVRKEMENA